MLQSITRVAGQLIFCSPEQILHRTVVEQDENKNIIRLFSLDNNQVESAHTLFFDGIISGDICSIKRYKTPEEITGISSDYKYIDLSGKSSISDITNTNKPLILDFGMVTLAEMNSRLANIIPILGAFSIMEIIAACVYYPAIVLGQPAVMSPNSPTQLLLWESVDLVNKKITQHTRIRPIN